MNFNIISNPLLSELRKYQFKQAFMAFIFNFRFREGLKKSRIRETKHLSTDADSSTDITVGWTKNTQKPNFFENGTNYPKC